MFRKKPRVELVPEWMLVGLGNPGPEYRGTRHNVGFDLIDLIAERSRIKLDRSKHRARYGVGKVGQTTAILVKPLTYMNLSGQAVAPLAREYGIPPGRILVVADEMDLPVGRMRIRPGGSAGGHNGHKSIIHSLGTQEYPRIRIGIGGGGGGQAVQHVLGSFRPEDRLRIREVLESAAEAVECALESGVEPCMARFNGIGKADGGAAEPD
jgi:peptidyl-tRNA hydrolase, PTH1 family